MYEFKKEGTTVLVTAPLAGGGGANQEEIRNSKAPTGSVRTTSSSTMASSQPIYSSMVDKMPTPPKKAPPKKKKKKLTWSKSEAKVILYDHLANKIISCEPEETPSPKTIYEQYFKDLPEFQIWGYKNFSSRLRSLQKTVKSKQKMHERDEAAFKADRLTYPEPQFDRRMHNGCLIPFWNTSKAKETLMKDMDNDYHLSMAPKELWESEDSYQQFPLDIFRDHIYQERHRRKENTKKTTKVKCRTRT